MKKDTVVELATYIIVGSLAWVIFPLLGKFIDSFYFSYAGVFANSVPVLLAGVLLLVPGAALAFWTIYLFKTKGQGTPNPTLPPKVLIANGPYRFSRNPMAFGGLLLLLGEAAIYYSPTLLGIAILYGVGINLYIIFVEEPLLKERFGKPYQDYLKQVPRFFPIRWKWSK